VASGFKTSRDFDKQLAKAAQPALKQIARQMQKAIDTVAARYEGRPVAEIKPVLKRELDRFGGSMPDAELTKYAQLISDGTPIKLRVGK